MNSSSIGVLINHLRNRQDTHDFLVKLSNVETVTLLIDIEDKSVAETLGIDYHILNPLSKKNRFIYNLLFPFQRQTRLHRKEILNARLKSIKSSNYIEYRYKSVFLYIALSLRRFFSANFIYRFLSYKDLPKLSSALVFSVVNRYDILGELAKREVTSDLYVYSWDHPVKEVCFNYRFRNVLVWSKGISEDIKILHNCKEVSFVPIGSTQLFYMSENNVPKDRLKFNFLYFIFSLGRREMVLQELELLKELTENFSQKWPELKVIIRLYPNTAPDVLSEVQKALSPLSVIVDDNILPNLDSESKKRLLLKEASLVIHSGTTVGIEADVVNDCVVNFSYRDVDYASKLNITPNLDLSQNAFRQWHIQKYFVNRKGAHVAHSVNDILNIYDVCLPRIEINSNPYGINLINVDDFFTRYMEVTN